MIIIDDGSTDNSRQIIEEYKSSEKVFIIYQKNKGLNITNNIALRASSGKYIMRLDADDYLEHDALEVLSQELESDDSLGLVFPNYYYINAQNSVIGEEIRHDFENDVTLLDQAAHGACTMIRTQFLKDVGGYNESYNCQDGYELWVKFITHFKVKNVKRHLFYYRQHGKNLTTNEQRILDTRASINKDFINQANKKVDSVAIIPVRGGHRSIAFEPLGKSRILDIKIEEAIKAENIKQIVVTSSNDSIQEYIDQNYGGHNKVSFYKRPKELARYNEDLRQTAIGVCDHLSVKNDVKALIVLSIEFPFIKSHQMDDAINTMFLFDSDSLVSVRVENSLFYQHKGSGMEPILRQDQFTKLEREALYRQTGGMIVSKIETLRKMERLIGGKVGHIVLDQKSAMGLNSAIDLELANYLFDQK